MKKINLNKELKFIQSEIHKEKPTAKNLLKRELLFSLQILLFSLKDKKQTEIYQKTKEFYDGIS